MIIIFLLVLFIIILQLLFSSDYGSDYYEEVEYGDNSCEDGRDCHLYIYEDQCEKYGEENLPHKHNCKDYKCCNDCPLYY